jgi:hypothetical protein
MRNHLFWLMITVAVGLSMLAFGVSMKEHSPITAACTCDPDDSTCTNHVFESPNGRYSYCALRADGRSTCCVTLNPRKLDRSGT